MTDEAADNRLTYAAFISYSHADNRQEGRKWADWLHWAMLPEPEKQKDRDVVLRIPFLVQGNGAKPSV